MCLEVPERDGVHIIVLGIFNAYLLTSVRLEVVKNGTVQTPGIQLEKKVLLRGPNGTVVMVFLAEATDDLSFVSIFFIHKVPILFQYV